MTIENPLANDLDHVLFHTEELWPSVRGERFFLTGGTGFVGTWLIESLLWANRRLSLGISVVVLTRNPDAFRRRSPHLADDPALTMCLGDGPSFAYPDGEFPLIIHAATEAYVAPDLKRPASTLDRDLATTRRVLEMARMQRTRRLLFTSSGAVYGKQLPEMSHVPENYPGGPYPTDTSSAYGQGKRISEYYCACYSQVYGFEATIARLFAFIGPHLPLDANYAAGNFLRDAMAGGPIEIQGDGTPYRSYLYAADLAIWLWTIFFRGQALRPYNTGSAQEISIAAMARAIARQTAPTVDIRIAKSAVPTAPVLRYVPDTQRAERELGLRVQIPLDEAIRRTHAWHKR